jgi:serine/threonine-protein kinase HipA
MQKLAASAGFTNWKKAQQCIQEVVDAISQFRQFAEQHGVSKTTVLAIEKTLAERKQENAALIA